MSLHARFERLRASALSLVQAALAAGLAWAVATEVLDEQRPFFAPVTALITLAITGGQRGRRALEVGAGVTIGIAVADAIVHFVGSGIVQRSSCCWRWRSRSCSAAACWW